MEVLLAVIVLWHPSFLASLVSSKTENPKMMDWKRASESFFMTASSTYALSTVKRGTSRQTTMKT